MTKYTSHKAEAQQEGLPDDAYTGTVGDAVRGLLDPGTSPPVLVIQDSFVELARR